MATETRGAATSGGRSPRRKAAHPKRRTDVGVVATCFAILTAVVTGVGISSAMSGKFALATNLAYVATGLSVVAVLAGVMAVFTKRGRGWGLFAIVLGILASPPILTDIMNWAGGLG
jgi:uncharacterized membrane protein YuzA (DUF378 family)